MGRQTGSQEGSPRGTFVLDYQIISPYSLFFDGGRKEHRWETKRQAGTPGGSCTFASARPSTSRYFTYVCIRIYIFAAARGRRKRKFPLSDGDSLAPRTDPQRTQGVRGKHKELFPLKGAHVCWFSLGGPFVAAQKRGNPCGAALNDCILTPARKSGDHTVNSERRHPKPLFGSAQRRENIGIL